MASPTSESLIDIKSSDEVVLDVTVDDGERRATARPWGEGERGRAVTVDVGSELKELRERLLAKAEAEADQLGELRRCDFPPTTTIAR